AGQQKSTAHSANEARAEYFAAMAELNRGDGELILGRFAQANQHYTAAKSPLLRAAELWRLSAAEAGSNFETVARQAAICDVRARYCDARIELALAEQEVFLGQHKKAAERFLSAEAIFLELCERSITARDEPRMQELMRASASYCIGRSLFEVGLANRGSDLRGAATTLEDAAVIFETQGEGRWADYLRAITAEYKVLAMREQ